MGLHQNSRSVRVLLALTRNIVMRNTTERSSRSPSTSPHRYTQRTHLTPERSWCAHDRDIDFVEQLPADLVERPQAADSLYLHSDTDYVLVPLSKTGDAVQALKLDGWVVVNEREAIWQ